MTPPVALCLRVGGAVACLLIAITLATRGWTAYAVVGWVVAAFAYGGWAFDA